MTDTPITSVPFTASSAGRYYFTGDLVSNGGDAITIAEDGVEIDGMGYTLTYADTATGYGINSGYKSNFNIHNLTLNQGAYNYTGSSTYVTVGIRIATGGGTITACTFNVGRYVTGSKCIAGVDTQGMATDINHCDFYWVANNSVSSTKFGFITLEQAYKGSTINYCNFTATGTAPYGTGGDYHGSFGMGGAGTSDLPLDIHHNTLTVGSGIDKMDGPGCFGTPYVWIHDNVIDNSGTGGIEATGPRGISIDGVSTYWRVYNNEVTLPSATSVGGLRVRFGAAYGLCYGNTFDCASNCIFDGEEDESAHPAHRYPHDNYFHDNILTGTGTPVIIDARSDTERYAYNTYAGSSKRIIFLAGLAGSGQAPANTDFYTESGLLGANCSTQGQDPAGTGITIRNCGIHQSDVIIDSGNWDIVVSGVTPPSTKDTRLRLRV